MSGTAKTITMTAQSASRNSSTPSVAPRPAGLQAVLFDLDGVVADTTPVHARTWKALLDDVLVRRGQRGHAACEPFDADSDFDRYFADDSREDAVKSFLLSRGVELPYRFFDPGSPCLSRR